MERNGVFTDLRLGVTTLIPATLGHPRRRGLDRLIVEGYFQSTNYQDRITIKPGKRSGKPCIRGLRITVYDVLDYLASGMTEEEILDDFPDLTREDIRACLAFAADRELKVMTIPA